MASMEDIKEEKIRFEEEAAIYEKALLTFKGVDGWDVYNCSVPFMWKGKQHLYGRVERRNEWANSFVRLFVKTGEDEFTVVEDNFIFQLEDPYISNIDGVMVFGGTHVRKTECKVFNYYCDFYRGSPQLLNYFTSGPDSMKDIRVVKLSNHQIGVFSRPKTAAYSAIGFTVIDSLDNLTPEVVEEAQPLNVLHADCWGGVNQAYLLTNHKIGCIGHYSYLDYDEFGMQIAVYMNYSFVVDPVTRDVEDAKIIGTKGCFPPCEPKVPKLVDCAFVSGIVMREDGLCDLYSGLGDAHEGRITIDYPFADHGDIIDNLHF